MSTVHVTVPRMLADLVDGQRRFDVDAATVGDALDAITTRHPELEVHLFDESGAIRQHVSLFHNERMAGGRSSPVGAGDRLVVLQAVSGGHLASERRELAGGR